MIVIISCNHYPDDERIYHKQIHSLNNKGLKVFYVTRSSSHIDLSDKLITHKNFSIKIDINTFISKVIFLLESIKSLNYVQIHETSLLPLLKKIKRKSPNVRTIYDVHENMESLYRTFSNRIKPLKEILISFRRFKENRHLKYVDQIILANPPISHNPYSDSNIPVVVIENFPKVECLDFSNGNKKKSDNSIIYHGHLAPERGIKDLVSAMTHVKLALPDATLSLIGTFRTHQFKNEITILIEELGLTNTINIIDQVPHSDIWDIIGKHSVGIIPFQSNPLTQENTPTKLFEMMACGLEVVVTRLPPAQHFVDDSVHWCQPNDVGSMVKSIIKACSIKDNSKNYLINKKLIHQQYNWEKRQDGYVALFNA